MNRASVLLLLAGCCLVLFCFMVRQAGAERARLSVLSAQTDLQDTELMAAAVIAHPLDAGSPMADQDLISLFRDCLVAASVPTAALQSVHHRNVGGTSRCEIRLGGLDPAQFAAWREALHFHASHWIVTECVLTSPSSARAAEELGLTMAVTVVQVP